MAGLVHCGDKGHRSPVLVLIPVAGVHRKAPIVGVHDGAVHGEVVLHSDAELRLVSGHSGVVLSVAARRTFGSAFAVRSTFEHLT